MRLLLKHPWSAMRAARGRWAALLVALALSVAAVVALAQAGDRLSRAMSENYLATAPDHAQLMLAHGADAALARALVIDLAREPGMAAARLSTSASTRLRTVDGGPWHPALLFSRPEPGPVEVARGRASVGTRPTGQQLWVERDSTKLLGPASMVELSNGARLAITGSQHDPALAPASTEGVVYAYLPASTLGALPGVQLQTSVLLRFHGVETERDQAGADASARRAAEWLGQRGLAVSELRVPPLAEHPHQRQAEGAVRMLLACAGLSALLCAVTAAALLRGWLDGQRHELGVLKVLGASRSALLFSHLALVMGLTTMATLSAALLGMGLGEALAQLSAGLLNLELLPWRASRDAVWAGLTLGLLLPGVFTAVSVWRWADLAPLLRTLPEVQVAEAWNLQRAAWLQGNTQGPQVPRYAVSRTYPDGGHGQLLLRWVPPGATLQRISLTEGRWLKTDAELVINQAAAALLDRPVQTGDLLTLAVGDTRASARLVGRIEEPMSPPMVYRLAVPGAPGTHWRLGLAPGSDTQAVAKRLTASAALPGLRVVTERQWRQSVAGHLTVMQRALAWVAMGTGLVGVVALASALGSSVAERRRELEVLHALGASERLLALSLMGETLLVVLFSLVVAALLGGLLDPWLADQLARISGQPLGPHGAPHALPLWTLLALVGGLVASASAHGFRKWRALW